MVSAEREATTLITAAISCRSVDAIMEKVWSVASHYVFVGHVRSLAFETPVKECPEVDEAIPYHYIPTACTTEQDSIT